MNPTRNGKIARLPLHLREQLNRRLQDGQQGKKLVAWLNALPEVRAITAEEFGGRPVREQNLSEWKQGGYRDWLALEDARHVTARLNEELAECGGDVSQALSETLARWLAVRYAVATRRLVETEGPEQWRLLRELCGDVVELRRGDHSARRLELECARVAAIGRGATAHPPVRSSKRCWPSPMSTGWSSSSRNRSPASTTSGTSHSFSPSNIGLIWAKPPATHFPAISAS